MATFRCPKCKCEYFASGKNCIVCTKCGAVVSNAYAHYDDLPKQNKRKTVNDLNDYIKTYGWTNTR